MALSLSKGQPKAISSKIWMEAYLYILRLQSGNLYVGCTKDILKRYQEHLRGRACRTTKIDTPVQILYSEEFDDYTDARKREAQIKCWSRAKKEALRNSLCQDFSDSQLAGCDFLQSDT